MSFWTGLKRALTLPKSKNSVTDVATPKAILDSMSPGDKRKIYLDFVAIVRKEIIILTETSISSEAEKLLAELVHRVDEQVKRKTGA